MANNKLLTLAEIFNNRFFRIPDYQRGYAWELEQLNDFWEDIENLKEEKQHYTGLITIEPISKKQVENLEKWKDDMWLFDKGLKAYFVIDGQQRLTTTIILLQVILSKFKDDDALNYDLVKKHKDRYLFQEAGNEYKSFMFGYEKDNPSDEYFKTSILGQKSSTSDKVPKETLYTSNLKEAKDFFSKKTDKLEKEQIEVLLKKIVNGLKFNLYEIDEELDVFVTFETMNNRGKPLSKLELLKNRLIYITTLLPDSEDDRNKLRRDINEVWKTVYEYLGKNRNKPLDDDEFLENHWIMYFTYDRKQAESYAKYLLDRYFVAKNILNPKDDDTRLDFKKIKSYIDSISESIKVWYYLFNPQQSGYGNEVKQWLEKLNRLGFGAFKPLIMASIVKNISENNLEKLLKTCERFIFLVFSLTRRPTNTKNNHFYRVAHFYCMDEDDWTIDNVIENIAYLTDGIHEEGYYDGWFDINKFFDYISEQFKKDEGFYTWNAIRYFLYEYELYLQDKAKGNIKVSWETLRKPNTVEHIYPQHDSKPYWAQRFSKISAKKKKILTHSLGNLLVLSQSKNSELQNEGFDYKKRHKDKNDSYTGYFNGSYSEIEVAQYNEWTEKEIKNRGIELLEFMESRWNIDIQEKLKLLGF